MSSNNQIKVGISVGDFNGIGMEVIIKTFIDPRMLEVCTPIVYGSSEVASIHIKQLDIEDFSFNVIKSIDESRNNKINLVNCWDGEVKVELGADTSAGGEFAYHSLMSAVEDLASNKLDVLVTGPINKHNMPKDKFAFPGHTEFLANYANVENPLMILASDALKVACVTGHIPLKDVAGSLSKELIVDKLLAFDKSLRYDYSITKPKIAVLGLNPHSGDNGLIGNEENEIIIPAINKANEQGVLAIGPYGADGFFGSSNFKKFDGILSMYHDQGLTGFKSISFGSGVNFTAGLPIVRTSPDHGTGYDIAGKGEANESSFRNAIYMACDIYRNRQMERAIHANPLVSKKERLEEADV